MRIKRNKFLIQAKYSDIRDGKKSISECLFGFGGELYFSSDEITNHDPAVINDIKALIKSKPIPLRLHAPIEELDYSKIDAGTERMIGALYGKVIGLCDELDIKDVVAHADFNYKALSSLDNQLENALSFWAVLYARFKKRGIHLNMENHTEPDPVYLVKLMKAVNSPHFGMCVDVGHFNAFGRQGMTEILAEYPSGSIREVHLADNAGDDDTHLPLGEGTIDFHRFFGEFSKRREDCVFVLEPRTTEETTVSLNYLRKEGFIE